MQTENKFAGAHCWQGVVTRDASEIKEQDFSICGHTKVHSLLR